MVLGTQHLRFRITLRYSLEKENMEPRTEQVIASFVSDNFHLKRIPGVDKSQNFLCAVCGSPGLYAVRWYDPIQDIILRVGRDCDRYVRRVFHAHNSQKLHTKLNAAVEELLAG